MLQRIYGTAFATQKELDEHLQRASRRRGRATTAASARSSTSSASTRWRRRRPFFHPKGAVVYNRLIDYVRELYGRYGYGEVVTPQILDVELWHTSGHYDNYRDDMFFTEVDERAVSRSSR